MKKLLSLALALVICLGLTVPALAVGKAGDTTIADAKGNIYTLSNPILYTIQTADIANIPVGNGTFKSLLEADGNKSLPTEIYAVSGGTVLKSAEDEMFEITINDIAIEMDDGIWNGGVLGIGADMMNEIELGPADIDLMWKCWLSIDSGADIWNDIATIFYIPADTSAPNPFANVETPATPETPAAPETPASVTFTDVAPDAFYAAPVAWAVEKDITKGTSATTFTPNGTCKIEQILTFLWRAAGSPASTAPCPFAGLDQSSPYYPALCWASEKGILLGEAKAAGKDCTRLMAVDFMYRYANSPAVGSSASFTDVPAGHIASIDWAVENNVTNGTGNGKFSPEKTCTRGEIVTFLFRAFSEK